MAMHVQHDWLIKCIEDAVKKETHKIAAEECELAAARVKERVNQAIDSIVLNLAQFYSIERHSHELVIRVQKGYEHAAK